MKKLFFLSAFLLLPSLATAQQWGEIRYVHAAVNLRADRSTNSEIVDKLAVGDAIKVDFCDVNEVGERWCAAFDRYEFSREEEQAKGYVYAPLLKGAPPRTPSRSSTSSRACCKICRKGKACGNSCIARSKTCHKGAGCACNG